MAAPKGNKYAEGNEGGAPTLYKKEYNEQAFNYCLLGATDKQLGEFFNVTEQTINNWKKEHEEFFESIRAGKEIADIQVAKSLYQNCLGATLTKEKEVKVKKIDPETLKIIEGVEVVTLQEQLPPDTNAIKFWLTNRQSENWRNKQETDHTTKGESINVIQLGKGINPEG
ncbi:terminase [Empedobacter brevis]|uniref:terminase n=1 Tax=Empedobacter brevis TaxID=247 RepID=UPI0028997486|nr:terminase [Empedobacter brevis]